MLPLDPATGPLEYGRRRRSHLSWGRKRAAGKVAVKVVLPLVCFLVVNALLGVPQWLLQGEFSGSLGMLLGGGLVVGVEEVRRRRRGVPIRTSRIPAWSVEEPDLARRAAAWLTHKLTASQLETALVLGSEFTGTLEDLVEAARRL